MQRFFATLRKSKFPHWRKSKGAEKVSVLLSLELEGLPPTVNHLYRNFRHWRYKTAFGRKYQEEVSSLLHNAWCDKPPNENPVELRITFTTNNRRKWDVDNRVKALQDCLSMAGVLKDDRQVEILHVERKYGVKNATYIEVISIDTTERISE